MKTLLGMATMVTLMGCASTSPIVPYGKDTYILSASDIWGGYASDTLQVKAAQEANAFCQKQGKQMVVQRSDEKGVQGLASTSSKLIFSCT